MRAFEWGTLEVKAAVATAVRPDVEQAKPFVQAEQETEERRLELKAQLESLSLDERRGLKGEFLQTQLSLVAVMNRQDALANTLTLFKTKHGATEAPIPNPSWFVQPLESQSPSNS